MLIENIWTIHATKARWEEGKDLRKILNVEIHDVNFVCTRD